ncbi:abortive infection protein [Acinetobacter baumannii]|uniref:abortive infection protein n=1 Tax=Acinetobacter baumannii TaxID=470 RepID=UPI001EFC2BEC|nr:abortive infection protein [Acinetobacter baumannii]MDC5428083.1 abortive infection protein [Acinetobacter baumannii]MDO7484326.1 abortive infection protein [Acinetobacter baumannii]
MEKRLVAADVYIGFIMKKSRELIAQYSSEHQWLQELERLLTHIDQQSDQCGDTLIECSKSFIEAIAKNAIIKLNPNEKIKDINEAKLGDLFKKTRKAICEHSSIEKLMPISEVELFFSALNQWMLFIGKIRNDIGEVSHGKILPKSYSIDLNMAQIFSEIIDRFAYIILLMLLEIDLSYLQNYRYENFPDFNEYLDDQYELPNGLSYSRALFEQDYDAYSEELDNYLDAQGIEVA